MPSSEDPAMDHLTATELSLVEPQRCLCFARATLKGLSTFSSVLALRGLVWFLQDLLQHPGWCSSKKVH